MLLEGTGTKRAMAGASPALNGRAPFTLAIGFEDYFQDRDFRASVRVQDWRWYPARIEASTHALLQLLAGTNVTATWFVLGWQAMQRPDLVRLVADAGHEIACGPHVRLDASSITRSEFHDDVQAAKQAVEDACGRSVTGFRSPTFSFGCSNRVALEVLAELGFRYDSSIAPVHGAGRRHPQRVVCPAGPIWELPPASSPMLGRLLPLGACGALRRLPASVLALGLRGLVGRERQPAVLDLRVWELDPQQPRIHCARNERRRHYAGLHRMPGKLARVLSGRTFATASSIVAGLEFAQGHVAPQRVAANVPMLHTTALD